MEPLIIPVSKYYLTKFTLPAKSDSSHLPANFNLYKVEESLKLVYRNMKSANEMTKDSRLKLKASDMQKIDLSVL